MIWNIDPIIYQYKGLTVSWYGLFFAGGFFVGLQLMQRFYTREGRDPRELDTLLWYVLIGTMVGMRLVHCLVYEPERYLKDPLEILKIWQGGYASHGGAAGLLVGVWLYCRRAERPQFLWILDRLAIAAVLAGAFIRIGNFFNSEIVGIPTDSILGITFPRFEDAPVPRHPVQLYEAFAYLTIFAALLNYYRRVKAPPAGMLTGLYFVLVFGARLLIEYLKTPQATHESQGAFYVGQYMSIPFVLVGIALIFRSLKRRAASVGDSG